MAITITPAADGRPGDFLGVLEPHRDSAAALFCAVHHRTPVLVIRSVSIDEVELEIDACCPAARDRVELLLEEETPA